MNLIEKIECAIALWILLGVLGGLMAFWLVRTILQKNLPVRGDIRPCLNFRAEFYRDLGPLWVMMAAALFGPVLFVGMLKAHMYLWLFFDYIECRVPKFKSRSDERDWWKTNGRRLMAEFEEVMGVQ